MRDTDSLCKALGDDRYLVDGRELSLPMAIADLSLFAQVFAIRTSAATALLAETGADLRPAELWPGTSAVTLMAVQYRDNPLGSYNEAVVSLPAYAPGERSVPLLGGLDILTRRASHFVHAMQVDQEFAMHAGRFLWGYPKVLAQIAVTLGPDNGAARLAFENELVFQLTVPMRSTGRFSGRAHNLTLRDGVLRRVSAQFDGEGVGFRLGGEVPQIGERHPLAQTLRTLGLPKRPLASLSLHRAHATFASPELLPC